MTVVAPGRAAGAYAAGLNPLRGRDDELASLHRHLTRLRNGAGTSWLLEGAPGLGKSRLAEHAAAAALEGGIAVGQVGKLHAIASWHAARRKESWIPASSGARRWRAASAAVSSPVWTAITASTSASSARACTPSGPAAGRNCTTHELA